MVNSVNTLILVFILNVVTSEVWMGTMRFAMTDRDDDDLCGVNDCPIKEHRRTKEGTLSDKPQMPMMLSFCTQGFIQSN